MISPWFVTHLCVYKDEAERWDKSLTWEHTKHVQDECVKSTWEEWRHRIFFDFVEIFCSLNDKEIGTNGISLGFCANLHYTSTFYFSSSSKHIPACHQESVWGSLSCSVQWGTNDQAVSPAFSGNLLPQPPQINWSLKKLNWTELLFKQNSFHQTFLFHTDKPTYLTLSLL